MQGVIGLGKSFKVMCDDNFILFLMVYKLLAQQEVKAQKLYQTVGGH